MHVKIPSPKHYESYHGSSQLVRAYLDQIEQEIVEALDPAGIDTLRISLLIATPEELAQGLFAAYEQFDWRCKYAAVGVNGDFERYTLDKRIFLANIRREEVIDIDAIEHLSIDTVDTSDTLNNSCGVVRNIVVDNNARAV